jgi:hypothetical protein
MNQKEFKAFSRRKEGTYSRSKIKINKSLPEGDLLIKFITPLLIIRMPFHQLEIKELLEISTCQELMPLEQLYHRKLINSKLMIK